MPLSALLECEAPTTVAASGAPFRYSYATARTVANDPIFALWKGPTSSGTNKVWEIDKDGAVRTGIWQGTAVGQVYGGTGFSTYATGDVLYASAANTLSKLAAGTNGHILTLAAGVPGWAANASTVFSGVEVYRTTDLAGSGSEQIVTWDAENHDVGGYHSTASNTSRLTALTTGRHWIYAGLTSQAYGATQPTYFRFRQDGATYFGPQGGWYDSQNRVSAFSGTYRNLTAGQYVELAFNGPGGFTGGTAVSVFGMSYAGQ